MTEKPPVRLAYCIWCHKTHAVREGEKECGDGSGRVWLEPESVVPEGEEP